MTQEARSAVSIGSVPVKADKSVEPGTVELRDGETVVGKIENVSAVKKRPGIVEFLRAPSDAPNWVILMLSVYTIAFALILVTR